jgi:hypothetical protein
MPIPPRRNLLFAGLAASTIPAAARAATPAFAPANVRDFGARGDGTGDDTAAINAAIAHIRAVQSATNQHFAPKLIFPNGLYIAAGTINLTGLHSLNFLIDGDGSVIHSTAAGRPALDALGSRWLTIRDLTITSDAATPPSIGLQLGRLNPGIVADDHYLENLKIIGHFTTTCLLNAAAETSAFTHLLLWNKSPDPNSFCLIQDGLNHFPPTSAFADIAPTPPNQDTSFNENMFTNCDFRHDGTGIPVWLGDTARHAFIRCYAAARGPAAFTIYSGANRHTMLDIDCHCETIGLESIFSFAGATHPTIHGFSFKDHEIFASRAVFATAPGVATVTIQNADIQTGGAHNPAARMFDNPARWRVTGRAYAASPTLWNGQTCFSGATLLGDTITSSN